MTAPAPRWPPPQQRPAVPQTPGGTYAAQHPKPLTRRVTGWTTRARARSASSAAKPYTLTWRATGWATRARARPASSAAKPLYPHAARHRLGEAGAGASASSAAAGASAAANSLTGWKFCSTGSAAACSAANALRVAAGSVMYEPGTSTLLNGVISDAPSLPSCAKIRIQVKEGSLRACGMQEGRLWGWVAAAHEQGML